MQLTKRQISTINFECLGGKKHWSEKKKHCISIIKGFYKEINEDNMQWFLEVFVPSEDKRIKKQFFIDSQTGKRNTTLTPTDVDGTFNKVEKPHIGAKYHLAWAFKAAVFVLCRIDSDGIHGYVDNPKHRRPELLKIKLSDLRHIR